MGSGVTLFPMVGWWAVPAWRCAMTRKPSGNIFGFTQRRCEVSDESRERILTLSHSPSVIKPSQAMGVCRGSRAFKLPMSPMCSRAASDSVRQECGGYHCEVAAGPWCVAHFCTDPFVMCLIYVPKIVQIVKRILLPHFHSEMLIFDVKSFKTVSLAVLSWNTCKALFYALCGRFSVLVRSGQFSLKHYCISGCYFQKQKTYAKRMCFA